MTNACICIDVQRIKMFRIHSRFRKSIINHIFPQIKGSTFNFYIFLLMMPKQTLHFPKESNWSPSASLAMLQWWGVRWLQEWCHSWWIKLCLGGKIGWHSHTMHGTGIFTYIILHLSLKNQPNVGKYTIHGWYGIPLCLLEVQQFAPEKSYE